MAKYFAFFLASGEIFCIFVDNYYQSYVNMDDKNKILNRKKHGDLKVVAEIMGITRFNAFNLVNRPGAKRHQEAMKVLAQVIESRERLIEGSKLGK